MEMKYKTRELHTTFTGERFDLHEQSAQDCGRYDFLVDVARLERIVHAGHAVVGKAVFLTNDWTYWNPPKKRNPVDEECRIHHGRPLHGELRWSPDAADGTTRGRESLIEIRGNYTLSWADYSSATQGTHGQFRYVVITIAERGHGR